MLLHCSRLALALLMLPIAQEPVESVPLDQALQRGRLRVPVARPSDTSAAQALAEDGRGVFARGGKENRFRFYPWAGVEELNELLFRMKVRKGGEMYFAPGTYTLESDINVNWVGGLTISGTGDVVLQLADEPEEHALTTMAVVGGQTVITVNRPDLIRVGWKYQLFPPHLGGDRLLEFHVTKIEGNELHTSIPTRIMPHVDEIPVGCVVLQQINIFRVRSSPGLVIQNLTLDGRGRGDIRGHTSLTGIYATGQYKQGERPVTLGLTVRGCTFRNLNGRGIAAYGVGEVLVEGNSFHDIRAEAIEIDHYSSGIVRGNLVDGAEIGVRINDAFESRVEGNMLRNCEVGVNFLMIVDKDWINTGNVALDNVIGPGCDVGISFQSRVKDRSPWDNEVRGNLFVGFEDEQRVVGGEGNRVRFKQ